MGRKAIPMVGRRYGRFVVLSEAGKRTAPSGQRYRLVAARCDCGSRGLYVAQALRVGRSTQCKSCSARASGLKMSVRLSDGRSIAQIAAATGLNLDTVYHRLVRGWPEWRLGEVTQRRSA